MKSQLQKSEMYFVLSVFVATHLGQVDLVRS